MEDIKINSFTKKYSGISVVLETPCYVSEPDEISKEEGFRALWDTGAMCTCISKEVVYTLGLIPTGQVQMVHANGVSIVSTHIVNVKLPNNLTFQSVVVLECGLDGADVLIGMDIISQGDLAVCNAKGTTIFTFQVPPTHCIDFEEENK